MKIIAVADYQEMSEKAAQYVIERVKNNPSIHLGLATGGTPKGLYQQLINDHQTNFTSYIKVTTFNLDEYVGLAPINPASYHYYMEEQLFQHVDINRRNTFIPNGVAENLKQECQRYDEKVLLEGGIDLQILGIGENGHIGFNEPGTPFGSTTHVVSLTESTLRANAKYFSSEKDIPTHAITMGIATIMKSKEILLLASGLSKRPAMKRLLECAIEESFPASILRQHPQVTIIADRDALPKSFQSSVTEHSRV